MIKLQEALVTSAVPSTSPGWSKIEIHYERYDHKGEFIIKFVSKIYYGSTSSRLPLSLHFHDYCKKLQATVPQSQSGQWTWFELVITPEGKYNFDFHYGVPPLVAEALKYG